VKISPLQFEDRFEIVEGLKAGDRVVTSANFLIDSESRLLAGGGSMAGMPGMDSGGKAPAATHNDIKGMAPNEVKETEHSGMKH
jgi:Cu(I)/Ag(I) efflux system membrane fusion protein